MHQSKTRYMPWRSLHTLVVYSKLLSSQEEEEETVVERCNYLEKVLPEALEGELMPGEKHEGDFRVA